MKTIALALLAAASAPAVAAAQTTGDRYPVQVAPQAVTDTEVVVYRLPGAMSSGVSNTGVATSMRCTNYSQAPETLHFFVDDAFGNIVIDTKYVLGGRDTYAFSTNATASMAELILGAPAFMNGTMRLLSTTTNMHCTAMIHDASTAVPTGIAAHLIRVNPREGTQE
ncbi:hypothetical protein [Methylocystis parvus]|uniref:hypothetical protein n=1 Tax=Methylocystis parvus TaxID=134 RepID=UPI003C77DD8F